MYFNTPDRELTRPIRPSTEDREFKTTREYDNYMRENGLVEKPAKGGMTPTRRFKYNKTTKKVEEVV